MTARNVASFLATLFSALTVASANSGGNSALLNYANVFVPADATGKVKEPSIPWVQLSFDVFRAPLDFAVPESRLREAAADGWKVCRPATPDWNGYPDMSVTPARYTQTRTYVLYRDGVSLMIVGMYYSSSQSAAAKRDESGPSAKRVQHAMVIARWASEKEALEDAAQQALKCEEKQRGDPAKRP
jgi:hypothetical protein